MCGIIAVIDRAGCPMDGTKIRSALSMMDERGSGEGAGYAVYGAFPEFADYYAIHVFFDAVHESKAAVDRELGNWGTVVHEEEVPTYENRNIRKVHTPWRYFFKPDPSLMPRSETPEDDIVMHLVMKINTTIPGALVYASGKNVAIFKASGWPEDVADFYRIQDYSGYIWLAHNRYPTNTPGWWGGAHPFNLLGWSVVHNGEITSYGTNRRFIESYGYRCTMYTDTEVVAYLFDLLVRRHGLSPEMAVKALAPPFWDDIDRMDKKERTLYTAIRLAYGSAMMNGPFAIVVAQRDGIVGFTDRIKLRPLVCGTAGSRLYISSEESAIRTMEHDPEEVFMPRAGEPVIGRLGK